jgi:hypothetical protein
MSNENPSQSSVKAPQLSVWLTNEMVELKVEEFVMNSGRKDP